MIRDTLSYLGAAIIVILTFCNRLIEFALLEIFLKEIMLLVPDILIAKIYLTRSVFILAQGGTRLSAFN